jgi:hypothetical protein
LTESKSVSDSVNALPDGLESGWRSWRTALSFFRFLVLCGCVWEGGRVFWQCDWGRA